MAARIAVLGREGAASTAHLDALAAATPASLRQAHERLALQAFSMEKFTVDEVLRDSGAQLIGCFDIALAFYVRDRREEELVIARMLCQLLESFAEVGRNQEWILTAYTAFWVYRILSGKVVLSAQHPLFDDMLIGKDATIGNQLRDMMRLKKLKGARDDDL